MPTELTAKPLHQPSSTCILRNTSTTSSGCFLCTYAHITIVHDTTFLFVIISNSSRAGTRSERDPGVHTLQGPGLREKCGELFRDAAPERVLVEVEPCVCAGQPLPLPRDIGDGDVLESHPDDDLQPEAAEMQASEPPPPNSPRTSPSSAARAAPEVRARKRTAVMRQA